MRLRGSCCVSGQVAVAVQEALYLEDADDDLDGLDDDDDDDDDQGGAAAGGGAAKAGGGKVREAGSDGQ